ncbi:MAG: hypothetical protein GYB42_09075 [Alphaproteobacteria bacterium]|nr:hypothetical protein [Alphaproteobacteria bacterium]
MGQLEEYIKATQNCSSDDELFGLFEKYLDTCQIDVHSYHIVTRKLRTLPVWVGVVNHNYPDVWANMYVRHNYISIDPIIAVARNQSQPFHWHDIGKMIRLTPEQESFLEQLKAAGLKDGVAISTFGPHGTMAYFGLGSTREHLNFTQLELSILQLACQQTHLRYLELVDMNGAASHKKLSPRETEVLTNVAEGLSNIAIAEKMGVTENTVDTMLRRIFKKMDVNNRISAVLRGIGSGLILP